MTLTYAKESLIPEALQTFIAFSCQSLTQEHIERICTDIQKECAGNLSTTEAMAAITQSTLEKTSVEEPFWQYVAARMLRYQLYLEASHQRGYELEKEADKISGYGSLVSLVEHLVGEGRYGRYLMDYYTREEIAELERSIKPERDDLFNYVGLKLLADRYLTKNKQDKVEELPQERFMTVAMHLAMKENDKVYYAQQFYEVLSQHEVMVATPTLNNAAKPFHQLSSCFIDTVDDNLWSIYQTDQSFAQVSKHGGGQGIYVGKIRARGSSIRGHDNKSGGVIPWIKNYNNTALAVDQLGVRKGAAAIYLDVWHADILDFLNIKTNNGDDRLKAHDIFPGVCIPDCFMEAVEQREDWYLFDPHEIREVMGFSLEDFYDDEEDKAFSERYAACVKNPDLKKKKVPAIDIMKKIMSSAFETGTPFVFYRDTVNKANPNKHQGMIYSSNLCTEIMQNMSPTELISEELEDGVIVTKTKPGDFVVCNLSSINLGKMKTKEDLARVIPIQVRMLDNVIDLNFYPLKQAEKTNQRYRAIGLGIMGYHHFLVNHEVTWESEAHMALIDEWLEEVAYQTIDASMSLAKEKGSYPLFEGSEWQDGTYFERRQYHSQRWQDLKEKVQQHGVRNAWLMATAPTSSISLITGTTAGIDPIYRKFFMEEKRGAFIPQTAPDLTEQNQWYYKEAHHIDQQWSIKAAGVRQRHIDQAQSFNIYITPDIKAKAFLELYVQAWKQQMKTIYYVRSLSTEIEECVSCAT